MNALLRAEQLACRDGPHQRVAGLDFTLTAGETVGLLGTNGAGKSTTLAMLAGALAPSGGRVWLLGEDLHRAASSLRRAVGLLPERPPLHPDLSVDENLEFAARLFGLRRGQVAAACARVRRQCGLDALGRRQARRLSRGQAQRAGIALALVHEPRVLLLDEPTAGLDPLQAAELRALIGELQSERAILLSTHLLPDVEALCRRAILLHEGRQAGVLELGSTAPRSARVQLGSPVAADAWASLPGVGTVQAEGDGWWRLELDAQAPPDLAAQIAARGWGLQAYVPVRHDLAGLFAQLAMGGDVEAAAEGTPPHPALRATFSQGEKEI
jgi:ABC-2 type transport system ATP-binding protein